MPATRSVLVFGAVIAMHFLLACTGSDPSATGGTPAGAASPPVAEDRPLYFPPASGTWETVDPAAAGWDPARLDAALALAGERSSTGVVVLHRGRILAERHWALDQPSAAHANGSYPRTAHGHAVEDVASVQKSVVAVLVGMARTRGLLDLDDPVAAYEPGWSAAADQESAVTIRHVLAMTSGLTPELAFEAAPGTTWRYNTPAYHHLLPLVAAAAGLDRNAVTRDWLTGPLGMADSRWEPRPWAQASIGTGFVTSARDLARFGLLILAGGAWRGETIVDDTAYLAEMLRPSQALNPSYGLLWWVNGQAATLTWALPPERTAGPLIPSAPPDLVAAQERATASSTSCPAWTWWWPASATAAPPTRRPSTTPSGGCWPRRLRTRSRPARGSVGPHRARCAGCRYRL